MISIVYLHGTRLPIGILAVLPIHSRRAGVCVATAWRNVLSIMARIFEIYIPSIRRQLLSRILIAFDDPGRGASEISRVY